MGVKGVNLKFWNVLLLYLLYFSLKIQIDFDVQKLDSRIHYRLPYFIIKQKVGRLLPLWLTFLDHFLIQGYCSISNCSFF